MDVDVFSWRASSPLSLFVLQIILWVQVQFSPPSTSLSNACRIAADTMRRGSPYNYNAARAVFNFACNHEFMTINRYRYRCCSSLKSLWRTSLFPVLAGCLWGHAWDYTLISSLSSISHELELNLQRNLLNKKKLCAIIILLPSIEPLSVH